jgi:hypothetical protein
VCWRLEGRPCSAMIYGCVGCPVVRCRLEPRAIRIFTQHHVLFWLSKTKHPALAPARAGQHQPIRRLAAPARRSARDERPPYPLAARRRCRRKCGAAPIRSSG